MILYTTDAACIKVEKVSYGMPVLTTIESVLGQQRHKKSSFLFVCF